MRELQDYKGCGQDAQTGWSIAVQRIAGFERRDLKGDEDGSRAAVLTETRSNIVLLIRLARATQAVGVVVDAFIARKIRVVGVAACGSDPNIYRRSGQPTKGRRDVITTAQLPGGWRSGGCRGNDPRNINPCANGWVYSGNQSGRAQVENLRRGRQNIAERVETVDRIENNLILDPLTVKKHGLPVAPVLPYIQLER